MMTKPLGGGEMQFVNKNVDTLEFNTKVIPFVFSPLGHFLKNKVKFM